MDLVVAYKEGAADDEHLEEEGIHFLWSSLAEDYGLYVDYYDVRSLDFWCLTS